MGSTSQLEAPTRRPQLPLDRSSDERLARRVTAGDEQALGAIFERYQQELYRFCLGLLGEPQDAQDALQNTMVKALRALPGEKREIALRPWLYRVAHNEAIDLRRTRRETQTLDRHMLDAHSSVAERAEQRERLEWLFRDLGDLPERQRAVLVMRELSGLDFADIGAALGTSGAVVRQALYEARRNLEQMDLGRSMRCEAVARVLSDADGRISSRREIRAHLRDCLDCRRFQDRIQARKEAFAGIAPLSGGLAPGLLQSALAGAGGSGAGGISAALGGGAAQSVGTVGALKAVATMAAVAVIGTAAVERNSPQPRHASGGAPAPLSQRDHAAQVKSPVPRPRSPRQARFPDHEGQAAPVPIVASAPPEAVVRRRPSAPAAHHRVSHDRAIAQGDESVAPVLVPPAADNSPSPIEATAEQAKAEKQEEKITKKATKQEEKSAKQEEKTAKAEEKTAKGEAKGKPEHPAPPGHPPHPAHSQKPVSAPPEPEESPPVEATPAPQAEEPPESTPQSPNGKAKGHEKQLPG